MIYILEPRKKIDDINRREAFGPWHSTYCAGHSHLAEGGICTMAQATKTNLHPLHEVARGVAGVKSVKNDMRLK
jgi:hypothetical protein